MFWVGDSPRTRNSRPRDRRTAQYARRPHGTRQRATVQPTASRHTRGRRWRLGPNVATQLPCQRSHHHYHHRRASPAQAQPVLSNPGYELQSASPSHRRYSLHYGRLQLRTHSEEKPTFSITTASPRAASNPTAARSQLLKLPHLFGAARLPDGMFVLACSFARHAVVDNHRCRHPAHSPRPLLGVHYGAGSPHSSRSLPSSSARLLDSLPAIYQADSRPVGFASGCIKRNWHRATSRRTPGRSSCSRAGPRSRPLLRDARRRPSRCCCSRAGEYCSPSSWNPGRLVPAVPPIPRLRLFCIVEGATRLGS